MRISKRHLNSPGGTDASCHISSLVVHCLPGSMNAAIVSTEALPNMEVPERDANGKFVVLLETEDESTVLEGINQIQALRGVINVTLVYHQIDD